MQFLRKRSSNSYAESFAHFRSQRTRQRMRQSRSRKGVALTEAAVVLPVIVFLIGGLLQLTNTVFFKQRLTMATYVGLQHMAQPDATEASVKSTVESLLNSRNINDFSITISPEGELGSAAPGVIYTLTISAPMSSNISAPRFIPVSGEIEISQSLYR